MRLILDVSINGNKLVSKRFLFDTQPGLHHFPEQQGYCLVSKPVSKSKFQNLINAMSFDTMVI
jgi:hypothetical protein